MIPTNATDIESVASDGQCAHWHVMSVVTDNLSVTRTIGKCAHMHVMPGARITICHRLSPRHIGCGECPDGGHFGLDVGAG